MIKYKVIAGVTEINTDHLKDLFTLKKSGEESSDCTAPYSVTLSQECSLIEFLLAVLQRDREWGNIYVLKDGQKKSYSMEASMEYKYGKLLSNRLYCVTNDTKILNVEASGGWSRMDYYIIVN